MRIIRLIPIAMIALVLTAPDAGANLKSTVRAGARQYRAGKYDKALGSFRAARLEAPASAAISYNIGTALNKLNEYDESSTEFTRALSSSDPRLRAAAYYNLGTTAAKQEKIDEAIDYYKKALDINPSDMNSKYNIEFLRAAKTAQNKDGKNNDKNKKNGKDNKNQKAGAGEDNKKNREEQKAAAAQKKEGMSKEDAKRILEYFKEQERNGADKRKMQNPKLPEVEKDW